MLKDEDLELFCTLCDGGSSRCRFPSLNILFIESTFTIVYKLLCVVDVLKMRPFRGSDE